MDAQNQTPIADQIIEASLKHVPFDGWSEEAVHLGIKDLQLDESLFYQLFENEIASVVEHYSTMVDRKLEESLLPQDLQAMKIRDRVHTCVMGRIKLLAPHRTAAKKTFAYLALPHHAAMGTKLLYRTVNKIWYMAGDTATDFNFYTKRALLAGVYTSTLLYWFNDDSPDFENTQSFLTRRIENVMLIPKLKNRLKSCWPWGNSNS